MSHAFLWMARLVLMTTILAAGWCFGGIHQTTQPWWIAGVLSASGLWLVSLLIQSVSKHPMQKFFWARTLVPIFLAVVLAVVQFLPGPGNWLGVRSIGRQESFSTTLVKPIPEKERSDIAFYTDRIPSKVSITTPFLSLTPSISKTVLAQILLAVVVFLLAGGLFARYQDQIILWWVLALNGAALAFFGIMQKMTYEGQLFWKYPISGNAQPFASFVNRNNAAGFLNLSLAAGLGVFLWSLYRFDFKPLDNAKSAHKKPWWLTFKEDLQNTVASIDGPILAAIALLICCVAGMIASVSRGGILAAGLAILILGVVLAKRGYLRMITLCSVLLVAGVVTFLSTLGLSNSVESRLQTLDIETVQTDARLKNWTESSHSFFDFPYFGTGLGSFRYAHKPYQRIPHTGWFYHAENMYLQTVLEMGFVGGFLLAMVLVLIMVDLRQLTSWIGLRYQDPLPLVAGFAFLTQAFHSFVDFGLYLPANMMLFALIMGVASSKASFLRTVNLSKGNSQSLSTQQKHATENTAGNIVKTVQPTTAKTESHTPFFAVLLCLVLGVMSGKEIWSRSSAQYEIEAIRSIQKSDDISLESLTQKIDRLETVSQLRPDDAELHLSLANLLIDRYRLEMWEKIPALSHKNQKGLQIRKWKRTNLLSTHDSVHGLLTSHRKQGIVLLQNSPAVKRNLEPAYQHLKFARRMCPLLSKSYLTEASLVPFFETDRIQEREKELIQMAVALNPSDSFTQEYAGQLAFQSDQPDLALSCWRRTIELSPDARNRILKTAMLRWSPQKIDHSLFPDDAEFLILFVEQWKNRRSETRGLLNLALQRAEASLAKEHPNWKPGKKEALLARSQILQGDYDAAILNLEICLKHEPFNAKQQYTLAMLFKKKRLYKKSLTHARNAVRYDSKKPLYQKLISELLRKTDSVEEEQKE